MSAEPGGAPDGEDRRRVVILGAGGRDFHDFNVVYRTDTSVRVVAFTAAQIPGIADRTYPPSLAGPRYPDGIPIVAESGLTELIRTEGVTDVVLAYSDLSHEQVMQRASVALAAGAEFHLLAPSATWLRSARPVVAVCGVRTGVGKSQTSRYVLRLLRERGLVPVLVRHPMPYEDLEDMWCQRFASLADIDAAAPSIEEREEYEEPVDQGFVVYAGVDYAEVLRRAESEADVIVWDGGNNDTPFFAPDLHITVADALRPGHEVNYYPGELNVRLADVVVINKVDAAPSDAVRAIEAAVSTMNPEASVVRAASPVALEPGPDVGGRQALIVEDGPTLTHGGMTSGAGTVAARAAGARIVDPRRNAVGSIKETYAQYPHIGPVLPALGYSRDQVAELQRTIESVQWDVLISGTPFDLARVVQVSGPVRRARYEFAEAGGGPSLRGLVEAWIEAEPRLATVTG